MKETIQKLIYYIKDNDVILDGDKFTILSDYYNETNAFGFVKKNGEMYLIDEFFKYVKKYERIT